MHLECVPELAFAVEQSLVLVHHLLELVELDHVVHYTLTFTGTYNQCDLLVNKCIGERGARGRPSFVGWRGRGTVFVDFANHSLYLRLGGLHAQLLHHLQRSTERKLKRIAGLESNENGNLGNKK